MANELAQTLMGPQDPRYAGMTHTGEEPVGMDTARALMDFLTYTPKEDYLGTVGKNLMGDYNSMLTGVDPEGGRVPDTFRALSLIAPGSSGLGGKAALGGLIGATTGPKMAAGTAYRSRLQDALMNMPQEKMTAQQAQGHFAKFPGGVGTDELEYTGIAKALAEGGPVTKTGLLEQARANPLEITDVVKNQSYESLRDPINRQTKFQDYTLPGGEDYREMLLTLPHKSGLGSKGAVVNYMGGHYDEPNVLAHARYNTRTIDGDKTLFVEEIQSDWHQAGRKKGYAGQYDNRLAEIEREKAAIADASGGVSEADYPAFDKLLDEQDDLLNVRDKGVPDAPYKATEKWSGLTFRRMVKEAADQDMDRIAWTPGDVQADRYDLSKQINKIEYSKQTDGSYWLGVEDKAGNDVLPSPIFKESELEETVGKEMAQKIINGEGAEADGMKALTGLDLKVGGEGMKTFYDKMMVKAANKFGKKYGVKVEVKKASVAGPDDDTIEVVLPTGKVVHTTSDIGNAKATAAQFPGATLREIDDSQEVWSLKLTPEMKEALKGGVALGGAAAMPGLAEALMEGKQ